MSHHITKCREHNVMLSQCRCPSPNKQIRLVDCPGHSCPGTQPPSLVTKQDLLVYTLRVRAPASWDDMKLESATMSLNEAMESALQAVSSYINNLHSGIELVIEQ